MLCNVHCSRLVLSSAVPLKVPRPGLGMTNPNFAAFERYQLPIEATTLRFVIPSPGRGTFSGTLPDVQKRISRRLFSPHRFRAPTARLKSCPDTKPLTPTPASAPNTSAPHEHPSESAPSGPLEKAIFALPE